MISVDRAVHRIATDDPPPAPFLARREHFATTTSTNDVVAGWLAQGTAEVALATADEQTSGRGREGRTWQARSGEALLLSLGFRPAWLDPDQTWRLAAIVALAMAEAAETVAGLPPGAVRLKWPNDLVLEFPFEAPAGDEEDDAPRAAEVRGTGSAGRSVESRLRKLAGVLGETSGLGTHDPRAIVGIGINTGWRRRDFPPDLAQTMTSLNHATGGRSVDQSAVLEEFLANAQRGVVGLRRGDFPASAWEERQITTGRNADLVLAEDRRETVRAVGVDPRTGGLVVEDEHGRRVVHSGEIVHVRLAGM